MICKKKLLGIVVLGLFWCNVGFAEILKVKCLHLSPPKGLIYQKIEYTFDTSNKTLFADYSYYKKKKKETYQEYVAIDSWVNKSVIYKYPGFDGSLYEFNYGDSLKQTELDTGAVFLDCQKISFEQDKKVEIASMIDKAKSTCKSLGFKEGTEKFADCALKLYSQSVELAAEQNRTVVMQPQSSGSNTMTIYDPVRDSRALMKQGQRMLSGACTLGIDC